MKIRAFLFGLIGFISLNTLHAQSNILNSKIVDEIGLKTEAQLEKDNDSPLEYGYVHDRDILWGKFVWEIIDLDERVNFPLYFPVDEDLGPDRISLFEVLARAMEDGLITEVYSDSYFTAKKSLNEIKNARVYLDTTNAGRTQLFETGKIDPEYIIPYQIEAYHVSDYKIKGMWYFDKRQSEMKYRLLAICPVTPDVFSLKDNAENPDYIELFWVFYPDARDILHEYTAFNDKNPFASLTFDHMLNSRRFNATIYKEQNVLKDREISQYMAENSLNQLLEAERIKEKIRNFEHDMWNY
jgi:gliding motility associated protien GldN